MTGRAVPKWPLVPPLLRKPQYLPAKSKFFLLLGGEIDILDGLLHCLCGRPSSVTEIYMCLDQIHPSKESVDTWVRRLYRLGCLDRITEKGSGRGVVQQHRKLYSVNAYGLVCYETVMELLHERMIKRGEGEPECLN